MLFLFMYIHWIMMAFVTFSFKYHVPWPIHPPSYLLRSLSPSASSPQITVLFLFHFHTSSPHTQTDTRFAFIFDSFPFMLQFLERFRSNPTMFSATLSGQASWQQPEGPWRLEANAWGNRCCLIMLYPSGRICSRVGLGWGPAVVFSLGFIEKWGHGLVWVGSTDSTSAPAKAHTFHALRNGHL